MVAAAEVEKLSQKCTPLLSMRGKSTKKTSEGITSQNTDVESCAIVSVDSRSTRIQTIARS